METIFKNGQKVKILFDWGWFFKNRPDLILEEPETLWVDGYIFKGRDKQKDDTGWTLLQKYIKGQEFKWTKKLKKIYGLHGSWIIVPFEVDANGLKGSHFTVPLLDVKPVKSSHNQKKSIIRVTANWD